MQFTCSKFRAPAIPRTKRGARAPVGGWHGACWAPAMAVVNGSRVLASLAAILGSFGCEQAAPISQLHGVVVHAETAGQPLAGVEVWRQGRVVGKTSATGSWTLQLEGSEGQRFELE